VVELVTRLPEVLRPDAARTVLRPFIIEDPTFKSFPRTWNIVNRILSLNESELRLELERIASSLGDRHPDTDVAIERRYDEILDFIQVPTPISEAQRRLIGAYFIEEFSFESAALFNPSVVRHPDQSGVSAGDTRILMSLRGIGEGHISSVTFRTGVWGSDGGITLDEPSRYAVGPRMERSEGRRGELIVQLICDQTDEISERVIYPFMPSQGRGLEDVRLVQFTEDDGTVDYRGTFTAFNGADVRQALLRTGDFKTFEARGVQGELYQGKGLAIFPRKVGGRYAALGRQDNENIWLLYSDDFYAWSGGEKIITPKWPWEFIQMGNCGSPIELDEGWLVLTHGVGAVRNYCIGACLLDKTDPSKLLARMTRPLLEPEDNSRAGYVPNVIYSCGSLLRDRTLLLTYGVADNFAAFATVDIDELLKTMS
jgi:predicted GH43/DUF377 family glycosyl hydrolase